MDLTAEQAERPAGTRRAAALPAAQRREAIVQSTLDLMLHGGCTPSTKQIAEAAGIAEGTIFRVFPDKDRLIEAVLDAAFDPAPIELALQGVTSIEPFEARLIEATAIMQRRLRDIWRVSNAAGLPSPARARAPKRSEFAALTALFAAEQDRIDRPPSLAAQLLRGLTLALSHPALAPDQPVSPGEIVALLLDGIRRKDRSC